jgi:hypothetical protein
LEGQEFDGSLCSFPSRLDGISRKTSEFHGTTLVASRAVSIAAMNSAVQMFCVFSNAHHCL